MIQCDNLPECMATYAINSSCITQPDASHYALGVVPLDTLAAQWWNWMWKQTTLNEGKTSVSLVNIWTELANVLTAANMTPDNTSVQLKNALTILIQSSTGDINNLDTFNKTSLVDAVNEVHNNIGDLATLSTSVQSSIVEALNSFISLGGISNGYATLDSAGRIPSSQLPLTSIEYKGSWNASTNTPQLNDNAGTNGDMYIVSVGGLWNGLSFNEGDRIIYSGEANKWEKLSGGQVLTVNGKTGNVSLNSCDIRLFGNNSCTIYHALCENGAGTTIGNWRCIPGAPTTCQFYSLAEAVCCMYYKGFVVVCEQGFNPSSQILSYVCNLYGLDDGDADGSVIYGLCNCMYINAPSDSGLSTMIGMYNFLCDTHIGNSDCNLRSYINGYHNYSIGHNNIIMGYCNSIHGYNNIVIGYNNNISGNCINTPIVSIGSDDNNLICNNYINNLCTCSYRDISLANGLQAICIRLECNNMLAQSTVGSVILTQLKCTDSLWHPALGYMIAGGNRDTCALLAVCTNNRVISIAYSTPYSSTSTSIYKCICTIDAMSSASICNNVFYLRALILY